MTRYLNIASRIPCTSVEGPGLRYAVWVQGCDIDCHGCCNQDLLPFIRRQIISSSEIIDEIAKARDHYGIEGVTFLGGEPSYQAQGLAEVAIACQSLSISVMLFTGFRLEQLLQRRLPGVDALLANSDIVVDGPFVATQLDHKRNWVGSLTQRFHYMTSRYEQSIETACFDRPALEVHVSLDEHLRINGFPMIHSDEQTLKRRCRVSD